VKSKFIFCLALALSSESAGRAQTFSNLNMVAALNCILTNSFDLARPFSGASEVTLSDGPPITLNVGISAQDGCFRIYVDMGDAAGGLLPPALEKQMVAERKRAGLNRLIVLMRKGSTTRYTLYPDRHTYHTNDLSTLVFLPVMTNMITLKLEPAGEETVAGHFCRKMEWQFNTGNESGTLVTLWQAKDLDDFPIRLQLAKEMSITFKEVKFTKLDPALFEVPAGYKCLDSIQTIVSEARGLPAGNPKTETKADIDTRVLKSHQDLANQGDAYGELRMGLRYRDGDGVPRDLSQAREWLQKSADQGDTEAAVALAKLMPKPKHEIAPMPGSVTNEVAAGLIIQSARFGAGRNMADVTEQVSSLLRDRPAGFAVNAGTMGADPKPGKKKHLTIHYEHKGVTNQMTVMAGKRVSNQALIKHAENKNPEPEPEPE
jgi:hypothetical protein